MCQRTLRTPVARVRNVACVPGTRGYAQRHQLAMSTAIATRRRLVSQL